MSVFEHLEKGSVIYAVKLVWSAVGGVSIEGGGFWNLAMREFLCENIYVWCKSN